MMIVILNCIIGFFALIGFGATSIAIYKKYVENSLRKDIDRYKTVMKELLTDDELIDAVKHYALKIEDFDD